MGANKPANKGKYFVGHGLTHTQVKDLRRSIESALGASQFTPLYADSKVEQQHILWKICENIHRADFGIFDLSSGRPNVYIELGISLGLNKSALLLARQDGAETLALLENYGLVYYRDYGDLKDRLADVAQHFAREEKGDDFCQFCNATCPSLLAARQPHQYLILKESALLHRDLIAAITASLSPQNLQAAHLGEVGLRGTDPLCNLRRQILSSHFILFDIGHPPATSLQLFALGAAIGARIPWFLLLKAETPIPSILKGFDSFQYQNFADIQDHLANRLALSGTGPYAQETTLAEDQLTAGLERPFWLQLNELVLSQSQRPASIDPAAPLYLLQVEGKNLLAKHQVMGKQASIGRDPNCTIPLPVPSVSFRHAHIMQLSGNYYLQDNDSTNGTFLNGEKIEPHTSKELRLEDTITIGPYLFIVSADQPIPSWITVGSAGKTRPLDKEALAQKGRLLVLESVEGHRRYLVRVLSQMGYLVRAMEDARTARGSLIRQVFDLAIVGVHGTSGAENLEFVKHVNQKYAPLPVLVYTGYATQEQDLESLKQLKTTGAVGSDTPKLEKLVKDILSQSSQPAALPPKPQRPARAQWSSVAIRKLLIAAFNDEELTALCFDHFPDVYEQFGGGMGKTQKIQRLMEHCGRHRQFDQLLVRVHERNPDQYDYFETQLKTRL
jgi:pSer/pThr/pTyr-binding forkhead associated (FHA) protein